MQADFSVYVYLWGPNSSGLTLFLIGKIKKLSCKNSNSSILGPRSFAIGDLSNLYGEAFHFAKILTFLSVFNG